MPEQSNTEKLFESAYGAGLITGAHYLVEMICSRRAQKEGIDLPQRFWILPRWRREYNIQIIHANSLLKSYSLNSVLQALRKCPTTYTLTAKWLDPFIQEAEKQSKIREEIKQENIIVVERQSVEPIKVRMSFVNKKSPRSKLDE